MAGRGGKQQLSLYKEINSQKEWDILMELEGLTVVDVYASWCGPCKAITNTFRRIKNEIGDDLLHFAIAESDNIESLAEYRNKSQPTFLFYGSGQLVFAIRGCNGPLITRSITSFLKKEHCILDGGADREVFVDKAVSKTDCTEENEDINKEIEIDEEEEEIARRMSTRMNSLTVEVPKEIALAVIKPDAVKAGLVDKIIDEITQAGMEILKTEERLLTKEEAAEFYKQHEGSDHFEQLIDFMSSGPCMTVVVSKPGNDPGTELIPKFRSLIGPKDVNMAKEEAPDSLRAKYGTDSLQNAVHACDSSESAARELAFFYPDFNRPVLKTSSKTQRLQRTIALIRPSALAKHKDEILSSIRDAGFVIAMQKEAHLTRTQVEEFYPDHVDKEYFESLVQSMTSGPSLALCLARQDAVKTWRGLLGPKLVSPIQKCSGDGEEDTEKEKSLRQKFTDPDDEINPLHGADCDEQVDREMKILFPVETTVAVIKPDASKEKDAIISQIKKAGFRVTAQKEVNLTKELAGMFYKEHDGKEFFNGLTDYMSSGPTQFLILSREDAVNGFRMLLGPPQPDEARRVNPHSLRAQFAKDVIHNAVHGSSSSSQALAVITEFFPDVKLDENGLVAEKSEVVTADEASLDNEDVDLNENKGREQMSTKSEGEVKAVPSIVRSDVDKPKEASLPDDLVPIESSQFREDILDVNNLVDGESGDTEKSQGGASEDGKLSSKESMPFHKEKLDVKNSDGISSAGESDDAGELTRSDEDRKDSTAVVDISAKSGDTLEVNSFPDLPTDSMISAKDAGDNSLNSSEEPVDLPVLTPKNEPWSSKEELTQSLESSSTTVEPAVASTVEEPSLEGEGNAEITDYGIASDASTEKIAETNEEVAPSLPKDANVSPIVKNSEENTAEGNTEIQETVQHDTTLSSNSATGTLEFNESNENNTESILADESVPPVSQDATELTKQSEP